MWRALTPQQPPRDKPLLDKLACVFDHIDHVLIDRHQIANRVEQVAQEITADLTGTGSAAADARSSDAELEITLVPILTGSFMFVADLIRHLPLMMQIKLLSVSSYPGIATSTQGASFKQFDAQLPEQMAGAHVLVIDDILDSGNTLRLVTQTLKAHHPASLRTCVLLRKARPEAMAFPIDYVCFDIPDEFVVGYGLDFDDFYRNLSDIVTLKPTVIQQRQQGNADG